MEKTDFSRPGPVSQKNRRKPIRYLLIIRTFYRHGNLYLADFHEVILKHYKRFKIYSAPGTRFYRVGRLIVSL